MRGMPRIHSFLFFVFAERSRPFPTAPGAPPWERRVALGPQCSQGFQPWYLSPERADPARRRHAHPDQGLWP
jgi:hypothetical protein